MTAAGWDPPPEDGTAPAGDGGEQQNIDTWRGSQGQGIGLVCPVLELPTGEVLQCRGWSLQQGLANRRTAAARMEPLRSGYRDPATRRPSDAPDRSYRRPRADADLWALAAQLADPADDQAASG